MLKANVSFLIAILILQFLFIAPAFGQSLTGAAETAKIKAALTKRGAGEKSKVNIKLRDGREIKGYVAGLNADDFVIADSKTKTQTIIAYTEAVKVKKSGLSLGAKIGIAALAIGAVTVVVIAVGVKNLDDNIFPN